MRRHLAAVQMQLNVRAYADQQTFAARVEDLTRKAVERVEAEHGGHHPLLVVFPEDVGTPLLFAGLLEYIADEKTLEGALGLVIKKKLLPVAWRKVRYGLDWPRAFGLWRSRELRSVYESAFSRAAKRFGVYLVAGSILLPEFDQDGHPEGPNIYNISYVFNPKGQLIGRQKKVFLIDLEGPEGFNITPGTLEELDVIKTDLGKVGVAICLDAFQEEVVGRLHALGAEVLVQPSANPGPWTPEQQKDWKTGSWHWVWEKKMFSLAVNPMMVGNLFDLAFEGQASIVSTARSRPELGYQDLQPNPGFAAVGAGGNREDIVVYAE